MYDSPSGGAFGGRFGAFFDLSWPRCIWSWYVSALSSLIACLLARSALISSELGCAQQIVGDHMHIQQRMPRWRAIARAIHFVADVWLGFKIFYKKHQDFEFALGGPLGGSGEAGLGLDLLPSLPNCVSARLAAHHLDFRRNLV